MADFTDVDYSITTLTIYVGTSGTAPVGYVPTTNSSAAQTVDLNPPQTTYINRVYDTVAGSFVTWITLGSADSAGTSYPGPGTFGVNTSDYCIIKG